VATRQDYTAQEAGQGRLHRCESLETDFTSSHTQRGPGIGSRGEDLTCGQMYGLLPTDHFGARKQRSAEQALLLLQEQNYTAWRGRKVVSLIIFEGAYNGVCKERLLQRMKARGTPEELLRWIEAFCSERTATIQVNGQSSKIRSLLQAGLPQGSPLFPILLLFFNADLVQRRIHSHGGAIAFLDYCLLVPGSADPIGSSGALTITMLRRGRMERPRICCPEAVRMAQDPDSKISMMS
jgi:hypothetical protein